MPEDPIRILCTRPVETALLDEAARQGIHLDAIPFIMTHPLTDEALSRRIRKLAFQPLVAVFTSLNAVEAVEAILAKSPVKGSDSRSPLPWRIFCMASATRGPARTYLGTDLIIAVAGSAATLADAIIRRKAELPGEYPEVFFFCGDQRLAELPEKLRGQGIAVHELTVYTTRQTPLHLPAGQTYNGIAFFSPSAVDSFFSVNTVPPETLLFAIGGTTADSIRKYSPNATIVSSSPEKETLVRQMIDTFKPETRNADPFT
jgi:uroporphyrinogen-III synthase